MATVQQSIDLKVPVHAAYSQLTHFEDYPQFMEDVKTVQQLDDTHLHWTTIMANRPVEWDAEITEQEQDCCIAWRNVSGPTNAGKVELQPIGTDSSRLVFTLETQPEQVPGSMAGNSEEDIAQRLKQNLLRLRDLIESRGAGAGQASTGEADTAVASSPQIGVVSTGQAGSKAAQNVQKGSESPRNSPMPTSSFAAGSEGFDGTEEYEAPVTSSSRNVAAQPDVATSFQQQPDATGATAGAGAMQTPTPAPLAGMRHVGDMPQDSNREGRRSTTTSDSMGTAMQQEQQGASQAQSSQSTGTAGLQSPPERGQQPGSGQAVDSKSGLGGTAAAVGAAGGTDAAAGAHMVGGPATHRGGAPGGAATAGTTEPLSTTAAGGGTPAAGATVAGGTGMGGADVDAGGGDTRVVPQGINTATTSTSTPGGAGVSAGRNPS